MYFTVLNVSKLGTLLTASSCVFVPVDDPKKELLEEIAEVSNYHAKKLKKM